MDKLPTISPLDLSAQAVDARRQSRLEQVKSLKTRGVAEEAEVEKAASGFEALLLHQMLKSMWSTVETTGLLGENSHQAQIYRDMFNQAIADSIAEGQGIGVKEFLKNELLKDAKGASK